jgi:two-component system chemotaxis response regulator CheB
MLLSGLGSSQPDDRSEVQHPIRIVVVDDSALIRRLVSQALERDADVEVVGTAANGVIALKKVQTLHPDMVTMDIEMPEMDGITVVRELRAQGFNNPIIMFSTLTLRGASATLDALAAGASDYVTKPSGTGGLEQSLHQVADELLPRVHALDPRRRKLIPRSFCGTTPSSVAARGRARPGSTWPRVMRDAQLVMIGSSTGGPNALVQLLSSVTEAFPVPAAIVQHMPPVFTKQLAGRLDHVGPNRVVEASDGEQMRVGTIYMAPGGWHLRVVERSGSFFARLDDSAPRNYVRPSVDVLFESAVAATAGKLLAVVLTGMGSDGAQGARAIVDAGGAVIAQDAESSVVWGMPGVVVAAGAADVVLPLSQIGRAVQKALGGAA